MLIHKLNYDSIVNIIKAYLKSKCVLYYCNLKLLSKNFNKSFNIMLKTCLFKKFNIPNELMINTPIDFDNSQTVYNLRQIYEKIQKYETKSYYYVRSNIFNINFCKISFYKSNSLKSFYIVKGDEGKLLCEIKQKQSKNNYSDSRRYLQSLNNFEYIEI